ncbi:MAG: hypothetical protein ABL974_06260 [Prosthecobacter sp.]
MRTFAIFLALLSMARGEMHMAKVDAMTRVMRTEEVTNSEITLEAARGEWESLQIIVTGPPAEVKGVTLEATELKGPEGDTIPAPTLLREHYVRVSKSTPMSPLPAGDYPDALVPQDFKWQDLPNGKLVNQPFWMDAHVPYAIKPGLYAGEAILKDSKGTELQRTKIFMRVSDFDLPVVPRLKTSIMTVWRHVAEVHGFDRQKEPPSPALTALLEQYYDLLAEHRMSVDQTYPTYPNGKSGKLDEAAIEAGMRKQLLHRHASTLGLPIWQEWPFGDPLGKDRVAAMRYCATWMKQLQKIKAEARGYVIMGDLDEPQDTDGYAHVRRWGDFFNEVEATHGVRLPLLVTEQPTPDSWWLGRLDNFVDIWVPHFSSVWQDMEGPKGSHDIARRLKAGDEVWCYAALVQMPDAWEAAHAKPKVLKESNPPVWCLDFPAMNHRVIGWLMPRHGITGLCYWATLAVSPGVDVWQDAGTFQHPSGDVYNGDGSFIYPATKKKHGRDMPVASIRLKWLREMADDYDYLMLARDNGMEAAALKQASAFARGFGDWNDDMTKLYAARRAIAALITQKGGAR